MWHCLCSLFCSLFPKLVTVTPNLARWTPKESCFSSRLFLDSFFTFGRFIDLVLSVENKALFHILYLILFSYQFAFPSKITFRCLRCHPELWGLSLILRYICHFWKSSMLNEEHDIVFLLLILSINHLSFSSLKPQSIY